MFRLMTTLVFAAFLGFAWPASADIPPNCGPNKIAKNALECVCLPGAVQQLDGSCKFQLPGPGGTGNPLPPPVTEPDVPVIPVSPGCGTASCGPSVFHVPEDPDGTPGLPEFGDDLSTDDLNLLQQQSLINRMQTLQSLSAGEISLQLESAGVE